MKYQINYVIKLKNRKVNRAINIDKVIDKTHAESIFKKHFWKTILKIKILTINKI